MRVREAAVAGRFYPDDPVELQREVDRLLSEARVERGRGQPAPFGRPRALIVPHAGHRYSGPIAASAYCRLEEPWTSEIQRVLLIGPAHRATCDGLALSSADAFATPLGLVRVDRDACAEALKLEGVQEHDGAHRGEHSLEVQLPFLQTVLPEAALLPVLVGRTTPAVTAALMERYLDRPDWMTVISSDLSHFHTAEVCQRLDAETSRLIESLADDQLDGKRACGHLGVRGLLQAARQRSWHVTTVDLRHSGDTGGMSDSVVGYGAYVVC
jgi:AmmeMemoRadiSam system protein B